MVEISRNSDGSMETNSTNRKVVGKQHKFVTLYVEVPIDS